MYLHEGTLILIENKFQNKAKKSSGIKVMEDIMKLAKNKDQENAYSKTDTVLT